MKPPFPLDPLLRRYAGRRPAIVASYREMYALVAELAQPQQDLQLLPAGELPELADALPGAEQIMLGLCTVGPAIERHVEQFFAVDPVAAVILDELGTAWVKELARQMHDEVRAVARAAGLRASPSYRPGIGRWPLSLQALILAHVDAEAMGVRLLGDMLVPQKSISMIVALGSALGRSKYGREAGTG